MIFAHTASWLLDRSPHTGDLKTQTRRVERPGDAPCYAHASPDSPIVAVSRAGRRQWRQLGVYAVQPGRGKPAVGAFQILAIRREQPSVITPADAWAEGFRSRDDFLAVYTSMNGPNALFCACWVLDIAPIWCLASYGALIAAPPSAMDC
jgi:hypothetical protein